MSTFFLPITVNGSLVVILVRCVSTTLVKKEDAFVRLLRIFVNIVWIGKFRNHRNCLSNFYLLRMHNLFRSNNKRNYIFFRILISAFPKGGKWTKDFLSSRWYLIVWCKYILNFKYLTTNQTKLSSLTSYRCVSAWKC